jgi:hypothetical protein
MTTAIPTPPIPPPAKLTWSGDRMAREVRSALRPRPDPRLMIVATWFCLPGLALLRHNFRVQNPDRIRSFVKYFR